MKEVPSLVLPLRGDLVAPPVSLCKVKSVICQSPGIITGHSATGVFPCSRITSYHLSVRRFLLTFINFSNNGAFYPGWRLASVPAGGAPANIQMALIEMEVLWKHTVLILSLRFTKDSVTSAQLQESLQER